MKLMLFLLMILLDYSYIKNVNEGDKNANEIEA